MPDDDNTQWTIHDCVGSLAFMQVSQSADYKSLFFLPYIVHSAVHRLGYLNVTRI